MIVPRTIVIILNYCGEAVLKPCIDSVLSQESPPGGFACWVVDNGSTDNSVDLVRRQFPEVEVFENFRNLGFAGGNNRGIEVALERGAEFVVLLNMDAVAEPGWLLELVAAAETEDSAAILGSLVLTIDGSDVEFDGTQFDPILTAGGYSDRPADPGDRGVFPAAYACGAAMLLRTSALREIGLLEDSFFLYHEDVELSLRAWRCGFSVLNVRSSRVRHDRSDEGNERRDFLGLRNLAATLFAHYDRSSWLENRETLLNFYFDEAAPWRLEAACAASYLIPDLLCRRRAMTTQATTQYSELVAEFQRLGIFGGSREADRSESRGEEDGPSSCE